MAQPFPFIPWPDAPQWSEANASIEHSLQRHRKALGAARDLAHELRERLTTLFPVMDHLCCITCPDCTDACCRRACVWADFTDLLFFHLARISPPPAQLLGGRGERCRYGSPRGCRLDRIRRPFVCTLYLCPDQTELLRKTPDQMRAVNDTLQHIKHLRRELETAFIRVVTPEGSCRI